MMLLHDFLDDYAEAKARKVVTDYLREDCSDASRAEFLGHFLSSVFQPVLELQDNTLNTIGFEAFVRPVAGKSNVSPAQYFEELQEDDLAFADRLCRELHITEFMKTARENEFLAINIDPSTLQNQISRFAELEEQIKALVVQEFQPGRIVVEIDMSPELDAGVIYTFYNQLRQLGIKICLDKFDADCASFSRILHCKPDIVKFNHSWLDHLSNKMDTVDLVSDVVSAVHAVGAVAHLERIETPKELNFAVACGFDRLQGFHLAKPSAGLFRPSLHYYP